jgi:hypothetical protein
LTVARKMESMLRRDGGGKDGGEGTNQRLATAVVFIVSDHALEVGRPIRAVPGFRCPYVYARFVQFGT